MSGQRLSLGATRRRSSRFGAIALCGLTFAAVGCGASERATRSVRLDAARDGSLRFERGAVSTTPGRVSVEMANPSDIPHAIGIRGDGIEESGDTVGSGGVSCVRPISSRGLHLVLPGRRA